MTPSPLPIHTTSISLTIKIISPLALPVQIVNTPIPDPVALHVSRMTDFGVVVATIGGAIAFITLLIVVLQYYRDHMLKPHLYMNGAAEVIHSPNQPTVVTFNLLIFNKGKKVARHYLKELLVPHSHSLFQVPTTDPKNREITGESYFVHDEYNTQPLFPNNMPQLVGPETRFINGVTTECVLLWRLYDEFGRRYPLGASYGRLRLSMDSKTKGWRTLKVMEPLKEN